MPPLEGEAAVRTSTSTSAIRDRRQRHRAVRPQGPRGRRRRHHPLRRAVAGDRLLDPALPRGARHPGAGLGRDRRLQRRAHRPALARGRGCAQEAERLWKRDADRNGDLPDGDDGDGDGPSGGGTTTDRCRSRFTEDALAATSPSATPRPGATSRPGGSGSPGRASSGEREDTLQAFDLARRVCREAAARAGTAKLKAKLSSAATVSAVERLARSDRRHASTTEIWDRDPWLLNTPTGVVDLRSGARRGRTIRCCT